MIGPDEIERLSRIAHAAGVTEVELTDGVVSWRLRIERPVVDCPAPQPAQTLTTQARGGVRAPGVGIFHHSHPLTGRPAAETGQQVVEGQVVGYVQAGPCLRPATAPRDGTLGAPSCAEGALVGYGTLLYTIE